jgi:hypothetical protein
MKGGGSTVTQRVDPASQAYIDYQRKLAMGLVPQGAGLPPEVLEAMQRYGQYGQAGSLGLSALTGNADAFQNFQNPYQQTLNPIWNQIREQSLAAVGDQATQAGAFGGSRQGVAQGVALGQVGNAQAAQQYQSFNDAMQRALAASNLGFGAIGARAGLPQSYYAGQLGLLNAGLGPTGTVQTEQMKNDLWSQLLGAGLTVGSLFLPGGLLAKGATSAAGLGRTGQVLGSFLPNGNLG